MSSHSIKNITKKINCGKWILHSN